MTDILAIDPGLRNCGLALFRGKELTGCALVWGERKDRDLRAWLTLAKAVGVWLDDKTEGPLALVVEKPQVYKQRKGNPDDLLQLVGVLGATASLLDTLWGVTHTTTVTPRVWKGQQSKTAHHKRVMQALTPPELLSLSRDLAPVQGHMRHNVLDAVALGLWHTHRLV